MSRFQNAELEWCRINALLDINETKAATVLGTLPIGCPEIPLAVREGIALNVALDLIRLGMPA